MIKFFKNQDIIVTRFVVTKDQVVDNILVDLILGTNGEQLPFPLIVPTIECDNNRSGSCVGNLNTDVYLANSAFVNSNIPEFNVGKYIPPSSVFYPSGSVHYNPDTNPINVNGTYKGQIYNTVDKMYYNNYNNSYNQFGFNQLNVDTANLNLTNEFSLYSLKVSQAGDTIRPKSVIITNQSGDLLSDICDDGQNNLIVTGSNFTNYTEFSSNARDLVVSYGDYGLSYYLYNA